MTREVPGVILYLAVMVVAFVIFNGNADNSELAFAIVAISSLLLGALVPRWSMAVVPFLAIPIAIPFGYADRFLGSDAPYVWWFAVITAAISALLILAVNAVRKGYERRQKPQSTET